MNRIKRYTKGISAFLLVLFCMPVGHALMVINDHMIADKFTGAFIIGLAGSVLTLIGIYLNHKAIWSTLLGLLGGIFIWTGWVEFSFVWIAEKLSIPHLIENGQIVTRAEYLIMLSSLGLMMAVLFACVVRSTKCLLFIWIQKILRLRETLIEKQSTTRLLAVITFFETIMILWFFYLILLLVYDQGIAGDKHPLTYLVAFGSLFWSIYLFTKLIRIQQFDYAIRYAIPTVIIFWNVIEITGRWNLFKEIWVHPKEHWIENSLIGLLLLGFIVYAIVEQLIPKKIRNL